jgi:hypothetical protein
MVMPKSYSGNAQATTLSSSIINSSTSLPVLATTGFPNTADGPFVVCIDRGTPLEEKVLIASYTTTALTVADNGRGYDGTTAVSHTAGASVVCTLDAVTVTQLVDFATSIGTVLPTTSAIGDAAALGTSPVPAAADHKHGRESFSSGTTTSSALGDSVLDGSSIHPAHADHKHGRESFAVDETTNSAPGDSANDGTSTSPSRADHKHGRESAAGVPYGSGLTTTSAFGDSVYDGVSADVARADHRHGRESLYASAPKADVSGGAVGTAITPAPGDHQHPLGPYLAGPLVVAGSAVGATPNNDTFQFGFVNQIPVSGGITNIISFASAFPNACDGVIVCGIAAPGNDQTTNVDPSTITPSGFRASVNVAGTAFSGLSSLCYIAWGH